MDTPGAALPPMWQPSTRKSSCSSCSQSGSSDGGPSNGCSHERCDGCAAACLAKHGWDQTRVAGDLAGSLNWSGYGASGVSSLALSSVAQGPFEGAGGHVQAEWWLVPSSGTSQLLCGCVLAVRIAAPKLSRGPVVQL